MSYLVKGLFEFICIVLLKVSEVKGLNSFKYSVWDKSIILFLLFISKNESVDPLVIMGGLPNKLFSDIIPEFLV